MNRLHARAAALIAFAIAVAESTVVYAQATPPQPPPPLPTAAWAEVVSALAWPVSAVILAFAFRQPIREFVGALGARVTKLAIFKLELEACVSDVRIVRSAA